MWTAAQLPDQREGVTTVSVAHSGTDPVGKNLRAALRDAIRGSADHSLAQVGQSQFEISLVTMDPDGETANRGNWTVVAVVFLAHDSGGPDSLKTGTGYPLFLDGLLLRIGRYKIDEGALRILSNLDKVIQRFRQETRPAPAPPADSEKAAPAPPAPK